MGTRNGIEPAVWAEIETENWVGLIKSGTYGTETITCGGGGEEEEAGQ